VTIDRETRARLVHDVGKYVARTARNLPEYPSTALVGMLVRDLYELRPSRRASQVLDDLSAGLVHPLLVTARALLAEADALEGRVRREDLSAVARAAAIALEVEALLRELAQEPA
jgi:hypothetical protein